MTDDLTLISLVIGEPPAPAADVMLRARTAAGLAAAVEFPAESLALQTRPPRRRRRPLVSLTVALAACVTAAAVVVVAHRPAVRSLQPSTGLSLATDDTVTDAQLSSATSFHMSYRSADPACPAGNDIYDLRSARPDQPIGNALRQLPCGHGTQLTVTPSFDVANAGVAWGALADVSRDRVALARLITQRVGANSRADFDNVAYTAEISFYAPVPRAVRSSLIDVIANLPTVTSSEGHDALGRPVLWLHDSIGDQWVGVDTVNDWIIANGSGTEAAGGGPSKPGNLITTIDTAQPPSTVFSTGRVEGTVSQPGGFGVIDSGNLALRTADDIADDLHAVGGHFSIALPPGTYTLTGTYDGGTRTLPAETVVVPADGTVKLVVKAPR